MKKQGHERTNTQTQYIIFPLSLFSTQTQGKKEKKINRARWSRNVAISAGESAFFISHRGHLRSHRQGRLFGLPRLASLLRPLGRKRAPAAKKRVLTITEALATGPQRGDVTALAIQ